MYADYCIVAFAIIILISTVQWFVDGRKNFKGPQLDVEILHVDAGTGNVKGHGDGDGDVDRVGRVA